jgi:CheY-like chemotaxis protein
MSVKLLLADSSVSNHKVIELALAGQDVELIAVKDGVTAFERAREEHPDIVLADIELPRLDGYALCEKIKGEPEIADTRVFLLKTSFATYDQDRASRAGAQGMLEKPFNSGALLNIIDSAAGKPSPASVGYEQAEEAEPIILDVSDNESFADLNIGDGQAEEPPATGPKPEPPSDFELEIPDLEVAAEAAVAEPEEVILSVEEAALGEPVSIELEESVETVVEPAVEAIEEHPPELEEPVPLAVDEQLAETPLEISLDEEVEIVGEVPAAVFEPEQVALPPASAGPADKDALVERVTHNVMRRLGLAGVHAIDDETAERLGGLLIEEIVNRMSVDVVREVAWEVIPELAERMIKGAIEEIKGG